MPPTHAPARRGLAVILGGALLGAGGCATDPGAGPAAHERSHADDRLELDHYLANRSATATARDEHGGHGASVSRTDRARAQLATAAFQDVRAAEAAGWRSSLTTLGCFQDPERGGMGVHYVNDALLDDRVDVRRPEALVYELGRGGRVTGLVAHEYIVPVDAWHRTSPPQLFGVAFHRHPSLPLYVLHAWLWKDNARGDLDDWNPAVRLCPPGVPIFGQARPTGDGRS
ncbi:hypothetical protein [Phycicoccus avicenniae]|uniref:hypothetical protein n=1 Tax=Phycicoccus avicenniae TaxID=2828860 RepID=UPI003D2A8A3F